jgi:4-alpha-glucanotransferase
MNVRYHSHQPQYKTPFGAVSVETEVVFRLIVTDEPEMVCHLVIGTEDEKTTLEMKKTEVSEKGQTYTIRYTAPKKPCVLFYHFSLNTPEYTRYLGNNLKRLGGESHLYHWDPIPYQLTVHKKDIKVADWYKEGTMYQIFVDRFHFGGEEDRYVGRQGFVKYTNWNDPNRYIKDRAGNIVYWDVYGGNLEGIIKKLPYLKSLGVSILYLNPIFEAHSNHKYDTADYETIDSGFGDLEIFKQLAAACQEMGIHILLDGVFSHVGSDSRYFNKNARYPQLGAFQSKDSLYFPWFRFSDYPNHYESWWGNLTLPNIDEMEPSYLEYMVTGENSIVKRWLKNGAKGWRLDVADELPDEFIQLIKQETTQIDSESVILGEVWEDASNKESYGQLRQYFLGDALDSVMNYPFRNIMVEYIMGKMDGRETLAHLMSLRENYPQEYFYATMNLIGSHDTKRILTLLGEGPDSIGTKDDQAYIYKLPEKQRTLGKRRLKLLAFIQSTFPGVPCIYYGDEAGVEGFQDPYCRKPFPWGKEDKELMDWYQKIFLYRSKSKILQKGKWKPYQCEGALFSYLRVWKDEALLCATNQSSKPISMAISASEGWDVLEDEKLSQTIVLEGFGCRLIQLN